MNSADTHHRLSISSISERGGVETSVDDPSAACDCSSPESAWSSPSLSPPPLPSPRLGVRSALLRSSEPPSVSLWSLWPPEMRLSQRFTLCGVRSGVRLGGALSDGPHQRGSSRLSDSDSGGGFSRSETRRKMKEIQIVES